MRVISGKARGTRIYACPGSSTRPTADRVKEALFSILAGRAEGLPGSRFLDLFAGTGAIGIEALSRGAQEAVFVEQDSSCIRVIRRNLLRTHLDQQASIAAGSVFRVLPRLAVHPFDFIFLDPPYGGRWVGDTLALLGRCSLLRPGGLVITEFGRKEKEGIPIQVANLTRVRCAVYGDTALGFYCEEEYLE